MERTYGSESGFKLREIISAVSRDKSLDAKIIIEAIEEALVHAARRDYGMDADLEASYNEEADEVELFQFRNVVADDCEAPDPRDIRVSEARELDPETDVGDALGMKIDTGRFGRIAAQAAKQIIVQKVRDAERLKVYEEYKDRIGEIISVEVRRYERNDVIVELGEVEGIIPVREQMFQERFRVKDRVQAYVLDVRRISRGPQIILSRAHSGFLKKLFEQNVTEVYDGIVIIEAAARDPGLRSKVAVRSRDASVDPVGACVGMKGSRVQAIVQELNNEKIDIIPWDDDPARLVCNALAPAHVSKVIVDDDNHSMEVVVSEDQLSLAIGKRGQNVKLAAQLTGWRLDIKSEAKLEEQMAGVRQALASVSGLGDMHAGILVHEGIKTVEELADVPTRSLMRMLNLEEEEAEQIQAAARSRLAELEDNAVIADTAEYRATDAAAAPVAERAPGHVETNRDDAQLRQRVEMFLQLGGVGEAAATALAEAGYATVGDIIADSAEELAQRAELAMGVSRTIQIAASRYLQKQLSAAKEAAESRK